MWYHKGGTPAFQSVTASRRTYCGITRCPARLSALGNRTSLEGPPRCVGEHWPPRFGVQFQLVRFYSAQRRAGRPRSSPSPLRGELMWYNFGILMVQFSFTSRL
ncbi:MAG: hypothetical protein LBQ66_03210 [Planctomycetaceae bacterium]|nr:hypothetical protein [Planctomycetaceae bacterium]